MGIRGLTTFIHSRSRLYMEHYELSDTDVVIDGNSVACQLYKWHCKSNDCFGGDYDKYAHTVINFFQILSDCNITPYIIFDGGYEARKIKTVFARMKNKIKSAEQLNTVTEDSISVFPLFLKETFEDIVRKLNIKCVRCDFESDTETASIARSLNCPVMSYDSDYFILDVLYIPFSTIEMNVRKKKKHNSTETYNYIRCEVYKVEKFLNHYGGMDKSNLPVLAVLLGNDYVKRSQFSLFYNHLKMQKCHGNQSDQQKIIKSLIVWLQNETVESALKKVLSRYKNNRRKLISRKIQNAIRGYNYGNSKYLEYLGVTIKPIKDIQEIDLENIISDIDDQNIEDELDESDTNSEEEEDSNYEDTVDCFHGLQQSLFQENFRKCLYPPCFMDMLLQNKYYCIPQVENSSLEYSHTISSNILGTIHKILTNSNNANLTCLARNGYGHVSKYVLPHCDINVPPLTEVQIMSSDLRKSLLLKILKIDNDFVVNCVNQFPETWHLFIITLKYLIDKSVLNWPLIYSLLLCKIVLSYVDCAVGIYRSSKLFEKKFGAVVNNSLNIKKDICTSFKSTIREALDDISYNESLMCLKSLISYFQIDIKMKISSRLFDRNLVHSMAQFQSCFLHIKYLNKILNLPYTDFAIHEFYNGTLIYNLTSNIIKRTNLNDYIKILLEGSPSLVNSLTLITDTLRKYCHNDTMSSHIKKLPKRKKKNKKREEVIVIESEEDETEENEFVFDPHNKFSILSIS